MENKTSTVEIVLTRSNAGTAAYVAQVLKKSVSEVICLCLKGSTNPSRSA